jgi:hypothetical protein
MQNGTLMKARIQIRTEQKSWSKSTGLHDDKIDVWFGNFCLKSS